jgi:hypothetical protein
MLLKGNTAVCLRGEMATSDAFGQRRGLRITACVLGMFEQRQAARHVP